MEKMDKNKDISMSTASLETLDSSMSVCEADSTDADMSTASSNSLSSSSSTDDFKICGTIVNCPWNSIFTLINGLNPENQDYYIKAKVNFKTEIYSFPKGDSRGRFFYVHLTDQTATIKAVAFDEVCDLFFPKIELNKEYLLSRCRIREAVPRYKELPHDYELLFEKNSRILPHIGNTSRSFDTEQVLDKTSTLLELALEIKDKFHGYGDIFHVEATIIQIKNEINEIVYKACPTPYCKKKVVRTTDTNELYHCPKCNQKFPVYQYMYMLPVKIADWTGFVWATLFETAEPFLGINAVDIVKLHDSNYDKYEEYLKKRLYESHMFILQAKMNVYDEENRVNTVGAGFYKIDYKQSCRRSIKGLKRLKK